MLRLSLTWDGSIQRINSRTRERFPNSLLPFQMHLCNCSWGRNLHRLIQSPKIRTGLGTAGPVLLPNLPGLRCSRQGGDGCVETIAGRLDDRWLPGCTAPQVWGAPTPGTAGRDTSKQFGPRQTLPPDVCCCRGGWKWQGSSSGVEPLQGLKKRRFHPQVARCTPPAPRHAPAPPFL